MENELLERRMSVELDIDPSANLNLHRWNFCGSLGRRSISFPMGRGSRLAFYEPAMLSPKRINRKI